MLALIRLRAPLADQLSQAFQPREIPAHPKPPTLPRRLQHQDPLLRSVGQRQLRTYLAQIHSERIQARYCSTLGPVVVSAAALHLLEVHPPLRTSVPLRSDSRSNFKCVLFILALRPTWIIANLL
jgi:hypothetical protein